ncbi:MAG: hypothetical protein KDC92_09945 [Bacteroidetes bacterium]|nr:hypothetical protein [Bacteroidota bacterium]
MDDFTPDWEAQVSDDFNLRLQEKIKNADLNDYESTPIRNRNLALLAVFMLLNAGLAVWYYSSNFSSNHNNSQSNNLFEEVNTYNY